MQVATEASRSDGFFTKTNVMQIIH